MDNVKNKLIEVYEAMIDRRTETEKEKMEHEAYEQFMEKAREIKQEEMHTLEDEPIGGQIETSTLEEEPVIWPPYNETSDWGGM